MNQHHVVVVSQSVEKIHLTVYLVSYDFLFLGFMLSGLRVTEVNLQSGEESRTVDSLRLLSSDLLGSLERAIYQGVVSL